MLYIDVIVILLMTTTQVALGNRGRKEIKFVAPVEEEPTIQTFSGPEVSTILISVASDQNYLDSDQLELTRTQASI